MPKEELIKPAPRKRKDHAPQRSFMREAQEAVAVGRYAAPEILAMEEQYGPRFATAEVGTATARGAAEMGGVQRYGGQIRDAILASSPETAEANAALRRTVGQLGPSEIETELKRQGLSELRMGREMSPEQIREVNQASRAAFSSRGMLNGLPSAVSEVMNRDAAGTARQAYRRQFASGVDTQAVQRRASDAAVAQNAFAAQGGYFDPYQRLYGRGGSVVSGTVSGPANFQPYLQGSAEVGRGNQEATMQQRNIEEMARQFDIGAEFERQGFMINREDTLANSRANAKGAKAGAIASGVGAAAGIILGMMI